MGDLELGIPKDLVEFVYLGRVELVDARTSTTGHWGTTSSSTSTTSITTSSSVKATSATSTTNSATKAEDLSNDYLVVSIVGVETGVEGLRGGGQA
jgi:hypothetical protein